jgi:hypothetical protein
LLTHISFINDKLMFIGNHGELREINLDWLINEFVKIHLMKTK